MTIREIALTGFMGAGKTTTGRLLSEQLGLAFVDVDQEIERVHERSATNLFRELGEANFRDTESEIMMKCLGLTDMVVALGGAAVDSPANQRFLCDCYSGLLVFLDGEFEILVRRCLEEAAETSTYRPLLHQHQKALTMFNSRRAWNLANANLRVNVNGKSSQEAASEIVQYVRCSSSVAACS
jgi:shikimate kinase